MKKLTVRFSDEEYQQLKAKSQKDERSLNGIVREAIRKYFDNSPQLPLS